MKALSLLMGNIYSERVMSRCIKILSQILKEDASYNKVTNLHNERHLNFFITNEGNYIFNIYTFIFENEMLTLRNRKPIG